jgi:hypothetical protein
MYTFRGKKVKIGPQSPKSVCSCDTSRSGILHGTKKNVFNGQKGEKEALRAQKRNLGLQNQYGRVIPCIFVLSQSMLVKLEKFSYNIIFTTMDLSMYND